MDYYVSREGWIISEQDRERYMLQDALTERQMNRRYRKATVYDMYDYAKQYAGENKDTLRELIGRIIGRGVGYTTREEALKAIWGVIGEHPEKHAWEKRKDFADAEHELLAVLPNAFKFLHMQHGYNFCKPHTVYRLTEPYTHNSLKKTIRDMYGEDMNECVVSLLLKKDSTLRNEYYYAYVDGDKIKSIPPVQRSYDEKFTAQWGENDVEWHIEKYYTKEQCEKHRKSATLTGYVVFQRSEYILDVQEPQRLLLWECKNTRYKFADNLAVETNSLPIAARESYEIPKYRYAKLRELGGATRGVNGVYPSAIIGSDEEKYSHLCDILDKSGYYVGAYRAPMKTRLSSYKKAKNLAKHKEKACSEETRNRLASLYERMTECINNSMEVLKKLPNILEESSALLQVYVKNRNAYKSMICDAANLMCKYESLLNNITCDCIGEEAGARLVDSEIHKFESFLDDYEEKYLGTK